MKPVLLTDFGSTYTKLTAVDLDAAKLLGTAQAYTTVASDVRIGFQKALDALLAQTGPLTFAQSYACSSAAGGLRMMVSGLVPELTMEAARLAKPRRGREDRRAVFIRADAGRSGNHSAREPGHFSSGRRHGRRQQCLRHS